jgi:hypothetical protein
MNVAIRTPSFPISALWPLIAVFLFLLGGAAGYIVKDLSTPTAPAEASIAGRPTAICPVGTHVVVWYTARTWACVSDLSS